MKFDSLKEKCDYYRSLTDYHLIPGTYVMVMLDGRSFSKVVKKKFKLPFDDRFIDMMNKAAIAVCTEAQGSKLAFVQSDEISIVMTDFDKPGQTDSFFGYRLEKIVSILASVASGEFNKNLMKIWLEEGNSIDDFKPVQFDCKVWNAPTFNEVRAHFLYRQIDCIRNSKQQVAQQYFSHKQLDGLNTDEQIQKLKDEGQVDWWHDFEDGKKFGRFIWKETENYHNDKMGTDYERSVWKVHEAKPITEIENRVELFYGTGIFPRHLSYTEENVDLLT